MTMKRPTKNEVLLSPDLTDLLKPFQSGWVALSSDEQRVIASGQTLHEVHEEAMDRRIPDALFVKVIPPDQGYLPLLL